MIIGTSMRQEICLVHGQIHSIYAIGKKPPNGYTDITVVDKTRSPTDVNLEPLNKNMEQQKQLYEAKSGSTTRVHMS